MFKDWGIWSDGVIYLMIEKRVIETVWFVELKVYKVFYLFFVINRKFLVVSC